MYVSIPEGDQVLIDRYIQSYQSYTGKPFKRIWIIEKIESNHDLEVSPLLKGSMGKYADKQQCYLP